MQAVEFPMVDFATPSAAALPAGLAAILLAPLRSVGRFLVRAGERTAVMREVERLGRTSDADLARRGLTRESEIRRIFAGHFYV